MPDEEREDCESDFDPTEDMTMLNSGDSALDVDVLALQALHQEAKRVVGPLGSFLFPRYKQTSLKVRGWCGSGSRQSVPTIRVPFNLVSNSLVVTTKICINQELVHFSEMTPLQ